MPILNYPFYRRNVDEPEPGSVFIDPSGDIYISVKNFVITRRDGKRLLILPDRVMERYKLTPAELNTEQIALAWSMSPLELRRELGLEIYEILTPKQQPVIEEELIGLVGKPGFEQVESTTDVLASRPR